MAKRSLRCEACDRSFTMPAHYARHMSATHGKGGKRRKANGKRGRPAGRVGRPSLRRGPGRPRKVGRPRGPAGVMKLARMSLEQLGALIDAARVEARRKISEISRTFA